MPPTNKAIKKEIVFSQTNLPDIICPFLGTEIEPETHFQYSCEWNFCHKSDKPRQILATHQDDYCLKVQHKKCEVYREETPNIFPENLLTRPDSKESPGYSHRLLLYSIAGLLFIVFLIFGVYRYLEARSSEDVRVFSSIAFVHHDLETSRAFGLGEPMLPPNFRPITRPRTLPHVPPTSACQPGVILFPPARCDPKNGPRFESYRISMSSFQSIWVG